MYIHWNSNQSGQNTKFKLLETQVVENILYFIIQHKDFNL